MAIKLIAMDLDGTLLNSDKLVSQRSLDVIQAAKEKGVGVTIATGRMLQSAEYFARIIGVNVPMVYCNGSVVQGVGEEEPIFRRTFPEEVVRRLLTMCHEKGWYIQWYIGRDIFAEDYRQEYFYSYRTTEDFTIREVGDRFLEYTQGVVQCVVRDMSGGISDIVTEIRREFGNAVLPQQHTGFSVDLNPQGVHKDVGLAALVEHLGIKREEVMACGDADNDLDMLRFAGVSVVPANGSNEARALADYLAESNDADGIAKAIEKLVLA